MTIQWGDTGRVAVGTLKTFNLSLATPNETLLGTPVSGLPTANPGSAGAQISYTIQQSDIPTITPSPISTQYGMIFYVGGKNTDAASQSINYQVFKNGTSVVSAGASSIATNTYYTLNFNIYNVNVGDVISVALWCASANMNYDYYALCVAPTRVQLTKANIALKDLNIGTTGSSTTTLTKGNPQQWLADTVLYYPFIRGDGPYSYSVSINSSQGIKASYGQFTSTYGAFQLNVGDNQSGSCDIVTNATYRPRYRSLNIPKVISFREVLR